MTSTPRSATPDDATAVAQVLVQSRRAFLPYAPSPHLPEDVQRWVAQQLLPSGGVTVAEVSGKVVAVLAVSNDKSALWIDQLYVLPGFEGRGLGSQLLRSVHASATRPVRLFTFQQNLGAKRFYESHGYRIKAMSDGQLNEEQCPDILYELSVG
jgi:ribosomal protein S18 acetylase RimI-like enzyme